MLGSLINIIILILFQILTLAITVKPRYNAHGYNAFTLITLFYSSPLILGIKSMYFFTDIPLACHGYNALIQKTNQAKNEIKLTEWRGNSGR